MEKWLFPAVFSVESAPPVARYTAHSMMIPGMFHSNERRVSGFDVYFFVVLLVFEQAEDNLHRMGWLFRRAHKRQRQGAKLFAGVYSSFVPSLVSPCWVYA